MSVRLSLAACVLATLPAIAPFPTSGQDAIGQKVVARGCVDATGEATSLERTDLEDDITHWGYVRRCTDGRPAILTIDLVEHFEGKQAVREAARDGKTLEPDVDPVMYVRNRNPKLRRLGVKPDANVLMFDCSIPGCLPRRTHLGELPWDELYRFRLQNGLIVYVELPYTP